MLIINIPAHLDITLIIVIQYYVIQEKCSSVSWRGYYLDCDRIKVSQYTSGKGQLKGPAPKSKTLTETIIFHLKKLEGLDASISICLNMS